MSVEHWLAYAIASATLLAIPGPTVMLVVSYALGRGRGAGWATVPGVTLGHLTAMTVSMLGAGAVLATSATLFAVLKLAIGGFLIWHGIRLLSRLRPSPGRPADNGRREGTAAMFRNAYVVTALNPKSVVFFAAIVPQFIDAGRPVMPQFILLLTTFLGLAAASTALWALLAGELRARFLGPTTLQMANAISGGVLIGAGMLTAALQQS